MAMANTKPYKRKAQVFTIRALGLRQPLTDYGKPALSTSLLSVSIARSHSEVAIQGAKELIRFGFRGNTVQS